VGGWAPIPGHFLAALSKLGFTIIIIIITVEPLILVALNFGVQVHYIILAPLISASVLTELRDCC